MQIASKQVPGGKKLFALPWDAGIWLLCCVSIGQTYAFAKPICLGSKSWHPEYQSTPPTWLPSSEEPTAHFLKSFKNFFLCPPSVFFLS